MLSTTDNYAKFISQGKCLISKHILSVINCLPVCDHKSINILHDLLLQFPANNAIPFQMSI